MHAAAAAAGWGDAALQGGHPIPRYPALPRHRCEHTAAAARSGGGECCAPLREAAPGGNGGCVCVCCGPQLPAVVPSPRCPPPAPRSSALPVKVARGGRSGYRVPLWQAVVRGEHSLQSLPFTLLCCLLLFSKPSISPPSLFFAANTTDKSLSCVFSQLSLEALESS